MASPFKYLFGWYTDFSSIWVFLKQLGFLRVKHLILDNLRFHRAVNYTRLTFKTFPNTRETFKVWIKIYKWNKDVRMPTGIQSCHLSLDLSKTCHVHKIKIRPLKNNNSWAKQWMYDNISVLIDYLKCYLKGPMSILARYWQEAPLLQFDHVYLRII